MSDPGGRRTTFRGGAVTVCVAMSAPSVALPQARCRAAEHTQCVNARFDRRRLAMGRAAVGLAVGAGVLVAVGFTGVGWWVAVTGGWAAAALVILVWTWLMIGRMNAGE